MEKTKQKNDQSKIKKKVCSKHFFFPLTVEVETILK